MFSDDSCGSAERLFAWWSMCQKDRELCGWDIRYLIQFWPEPEPKPDLKNGRISGQLEPEPDIRYITIAKWQKFRNSLSLIVISRCHWLAFLSHGTLLVHVFLHPFINVSVLLKKTRELSNRKDNRAMRSIYGCPENFRESLSTPRLLFQKFLDFCSDRRYKPKCAYKIWSS